MHWRHWREARRIAIDEDQAREIAEALAAAEARGAASASIMVNTHAVAPMARGMAAQAVAHACDKQRVASCPACSRPFPTGYACTCGRDRKRFIPPNARR